MILGEIPEAAVWAIYFAPMLSFAVIAAALVFRIPRFEGRHASGITIAAIGLSWVLALWALDTSIGLDGESAGFQPHLAEGAVARRTRRARDADDGGTHIHAVREVWAAVERPEQHPHLFRGPAGQRHGAVALS